MKTRIPHHVNASHVRRLIKAAPWQLNHLAKMVRGLPVEDADKTLGYISLYGTSIIKKVIMQLKCGKLTIMIKIHSVSDNRRMCAKFSRT